MPGITLAVDEAITNVIRHAYHGDLTKPSRLICHARGDRLEFTLLDHGDPPDPSRLRAQPLDDSALSGRGTHLIGMIMDEVCYERVPAGNRLRLSKRLPAGAGIQAEGKSHEYDDPHARGTTIVDVTGHIDFAALPRCARSCSTL